MIDRGCATGNTDGSQSLIEARAMDVVILGWIPQRRQYRMKHQKVGDMGTG